MGHIGSHAANDVSSLAYYIIADRSVFPGVRQEKWETGRGWTRITIKQKKKKKNYTKPTVVSL